MHTFYSDIITYQSFFLFQNEVKVMGEKTNKTLQEKKIYNRGYL